jgi:hypothetical protein
MRGAEVTDAVAALKTVLGDREFNSRRGHYNFYVRQLMDMYGQQGNKFNDNPNDNWSKDFERRMKTGVSEGIDDIVPADRGEYDREGEMAQQDLTTAADAAEELRSILSADENLPEWVQAKITKAVDYLDTTRDYMKSKEPELNESRLHRLNLLKTIMIQTPRHP